MNKIVFIPCLIIQCICISGCSKSSLPEGFPKLYPCEITVNQGGTPLEGATVTLMPKDPANVYSSSGTTDASGKAVLKTYGHAGAPMGKSAIVVTKAIDEGGTPVYDPDTGNFVRNAGASTYSYVEKDYTKKETTVLEIEIQKGKNEKAVDVGKAVHDFLGRAP